MVAAKNRRVCRIMKEIHVILTWGSLTFSLSAWLFVNPCGFAPASGKSEAACATWFPRPSSPTSQGRALPMVLTVSGSLADDIVGKLSFLQGRGIKKFSWLCCVCGSLFLYPPRHGLFSWCYFSRYLFIDRVNRSWYFSNPFSGSLEFFTTKIYTFLSIAK